MVGHIPRKMEWCINDEKSPRWHSGGDSNVGCFRGVGQRCLYEQWRVVPAPMARVLELCSHHGKRTSPNLCGMCRVGTSVARIVGVLLLRQCRRGSNCTDRLIETPLGDASATVPILFCCYLPAVFRHCPPPREVQ